MGYPLWQPTVSHNPPFRFMHFMVNSPAFFPSTFLMVSQNWVMGKSSPETICVSMKKVELSGLDFPNESKKKKYGSSPKIEVSKPWGYPDGHHPFSLGFLMINPATIDASINPGVFRSRFSQQNPLINGYSL